MNKAHVVYAAVAALASAAPALAFRSGPPAARNGSPQSVGATCRLCHGNNAGNGSVTILGAPATYAPNEVYTLTVRVADPAQVGGGFQLSAENGAGHVGTLLLSDPQHTRFADTAPPSSVWAEHTATGVDRSVSQWASLGNAAEYQVQWRAPASDAGTVTFYAAGNAINNSFTNAGDIIYLTSVSATFQAPCAADLDGDGQVAASDLASLLGGWGAPGPADFDGSGVVDSADLSQLLGSWGACP